MGKVDAKVAEFIKEWDRARNIGHITPELESATSYFLARFAELEAENGSCRAAGWRDALSCIQYCQVNWLQDCKDQISKDALNDAVTMLTNELCSCEPFDWLNTEWLSVKAWQIKLDALEAQLVTARAKLEAAKEIDEGILADAIERAYRDTGQPMPHAAFFNILGRHTARHIIEVKTER